tara:strand:+ start:617 stop:1108 length:492 start_codon:yes stop_codon:yes gene_type:complete
MLVEEITMQSDLFREAWSNFATGVSVITSIQNNNEIHGMTANGIASISLDPMLVMVSVGHSAQTHKIITKNMKYAINILSEDQIETGKFFAKSNQEIPENILSEFYMSKNNSPFLSNSLASMDCNVVRTHSEGDHTIFIGEVTEIVVNNGKPLMFYQGKWVNF